MATWSAFKKNITLCHPSHEAFSLILLLKRVNWRITWNFRFLFTTGHVIEHTLYFIATPERLITWTYYWKMHFTNHRSDNLFWVLLISDNCDIFSEIADLNHPFSTHTRSLSSNNEILHINQQGTLTTVCFTISQSANLYSPYILITFKYNCMQYKDTNIYFYDNSNKKVNADTPIGHTHRYRY